MTTLSERLFEASRAEGDVGEILGESGIEFDHLGWDSYDNSLEIHGVAVDFRCSSEQLKLVWNMGFTKLYVNHIDKWETHYRVEGSTKGWRVSYPHKRDDGQPGIYLEEIVSTWPKKWFDTGYCIVKNMLG